MTTYDDVVAAIRVGLARCPRRFYRDLSIGLDPDVTAEAELVVAQTLLEELDTARLEVRMAAPPRGQAEWAAREHLRSAVGFAIARLPKDWLRRLQKDRITDEVQRLAAQRIVEQIELSNVRYEMGPARDAAAQIGSRPETEVRRPGVGK